MFLLFKKQKTIFMQQIIYIPPVSTLQVYRPKHWDSARTRNSIETEQVLTQKESRAPVVRPQSPPQAQ